MASDDIYDIDLFNYRFDVEVCDGIDLTVEEVKASRLSINAKMAEMNIPPAERAQMLHILGLATDDEFRPEFRPPPPIRWCSKKLHDIGDPANYRLKKATSLFSDDRVCLACEREPKAKKAST